MTEIAIWLLRWTIAGAALSTFVIAAAYVLERSGRSVGAYLYRTALIAALIAPIIAFAPPMLTFPAAPTALAESPHPISTSAEAPGVGGEAAAPVAQDRNIGEPSNIAPDFLAIALIALWPAGVAFAVIRRQRSALHLSRAFRAGAPYPTAFVACRLSADTRAPLIFGVLRPRMLAPADFSEWSPTEREAVLRHEAAHIARGDLVWAALGDAVGILYWWAPPVAALTRQHILATEEACDSASLSGNDDRHDYARALLAITRRVGQHVSPGLAATGPSLRRRIERLIAPQRAFPFAPPMAACAAAACIALALSGPAAAHVGRFQIYIFIAAGGTSDTYAISDGAHATAAVVQSCVGRRSPNASTIVGRLEARIHNGEQDELDPVTIVGPGSEIELGRCEPGPERDVSDEDTLVLVTDASERQARRLIREIHALPRAEQQEMLAELGLSDRR